MEDHTNQGAGPAGSPPERTLSRDDVAALLVTLEPSDGAELRQVAAALRRFAAADDSAVKGLLVEAAAKAEAAAI
jgi:hypothetical protein